jgi:excisionase family DNA binding protein
MPKIKEKLLSVVEVAKKLGVSRTYVIKMIQAKRIPAEKVGRSYVISERSLPGIYRPITDAEKKQVEQAVDKTLEEFGDVIKRLGKT